MTTHAVQPSAIIAKARAEGRTSLSESDGKQLLAWYGIRTPRSFVASSAADARARAAALQGPFVAKVVSPDIMHKSDAGGVSLHLRMRLPSETAIETMAAKPKIAAANVEGWLVEEMIPRGRRSSSAVCGIRNSGR